MSNRETTPYVSEIETTCRVLRPNPRWFLVRAIPFGLVALLAYRRAAGTGGLGLMFTFAGAIFWLMFKSSSMTLDGEGFTYRCFGKRTARRWVDVERFCVVEQRAYGLIPINRFLGWNYSPAYKNYKRLAIPRAVARWVGMSDAMIKPVGFNVKELTSVMNQQLVRARAGDAGNPGTIRS